MKNGLKKTMLDACLLKPSIGRLLDVGMGALLGVELYYGLRYRMDKSDMQESCKVRNNINDDNIEQEDKESEKEEKKGCMSR